MKKYFEILELDTSASIEEVEAAYNELSAAWQPEKFQNMPRYRRKAEIRLKEINDAYERIRSYLMVKAPEKGPADPEEKLPFEGPHSEYTEEKPASDETTPQQIKKPVQRSLLFGFIAIFAVLGVLMLYLVTDRKNEGSLDSRAPAVAPRQTSPADNSESEPARKLAAARPPSAAKKQATGIAMKTGTEYGAFFTERKLKRYNRNPIRVKNIQNGLITIGYHTGPIDGVIGPLTTAALKQFANDFGHVIEAGGLAASNFTETVIVFAEVVTTYPDWNQIIGSEDFTQWLDRQTYFPAASIKRLKKSATAQQVIDILNRYKSDRKKPQAKPLGRKD